MSRLSIRRSHWYLRWVLWANPDLQYQSRHTQQIPLCALVVSGLIPAAVMLGLAAWVVLVLLMVARLGLVQELLVLAMILGGVWAHRQWGPRWVGPAKMQDRLVRAWSALTARLCPLVTICDDTEPRP